MYYAITGNNISVLVTML